MVAGNIHTNTGSKAIRKTGCVVVLGAIQAVNAMRDEGMAIIFAQEREVSCPEGIGDI